MKNKYDLSGEYGVGYTKNGQPFYFDLEDFDLIKDYSWHYNAKGYLCAYSGGSSEIRMHRLVMNVTDPKLVVDHIKHINHDNRKSELRVVQPHENSANKKMASNNTSGYTGVYYHKGKDKYEAEIVVNKKKIWLGAFKEIEDAITARKNAEDKYLGEFSYANSMAL